MITVRILLCSLKKIGIERSRACSVRLVGWAQRLEIHGISL